jgi:quercetin dioxygenase-like cupin family protein
MFKLGISTVAVSLLAVGVALADAKAPSSGEQGTHVVLAPTELKWGDAPPGMPKGAKATVLEGDPSKPGPFTVRLEMPPGYQVKPHWHPGIEHVTVLSGELYMGTGEKFDMAKAKALPAGGFAVMPIKHLHYAFTKDQKSIIQLHGIGPWGITYVNPADDPRGPAK